MFYLKAKSFIKKDFIIESSYKLSFVLTILGSVFPIVSFFFVSKLVAGYGSESLGKYGGHYFSFVLIGIAFSRFFQLAVDTFSGSIKRAQMAGCLEAILSSQTDAKTVVLLSSFYSFFSAGIQLILMFLVGSLFFGFSFSNTNILSTVIALLASLATFISIGIFSAAGTVLFKQGEPIGWVMATVSSLLGGVIFPVAILPWWLQTISYLFPITYSLDALRLAMLQNYDVFMLSRQLITLVIMSIILLPFSLQTFKWAIERGKRDGTLMQY